MGESDIRILAKIYGWEYKYENEKFFITPDKEITVPDLLYKLYALSENSVNALTERYIYVPHPDQLNDIFDCNVELIQFDDEEVIRTFLSGTLSEQEIEHQLNTNLVNTQLFVQRNYREILYRKWGIVSMTSDPNNVLMWSYYGDHKGFCLEFDIDKFEFDFFGPFPINYQCEINSISIKDVSIQLASLIQCNIKDAIWSHENEWRLMVEPPAGQDFNSPNLHQLFDKFDGHNRKMPYPKSAVKSIALGNRFFLPRELKELNQNELQINLFNNNDIESKRSVLDFIASNEIICHIGLRQGFTKIAFRSSKLIKEENMDSYILISD